MRRLALAFLTSVYAALGVTSVASAEDRGPVVVELFTSQGCYSCPPADKLLHQMSTDDIIIPLALHVDYWDYIGWKDQFAHSAFSDRQRKYAAAAGRRSVYTPQMIINGVDDVVGNRPMDVAKLVSEHAMQPVRARLSLSRDGGDVSVRGEAVTDIGPVDVILVRYIPEATVDIHRGENAGKRITYSNIVTEWRDVGDWDGQGAFAANLAVEGENPVVVLLQKPGYGPILAAARLR